MLINNFANSHNLLPMFGIGAGIITIGALLFFLLIVLSLVLKGYALWYAAKRDDKGWFIALLLVNTFGILELFYLYVIVGRWKNTKDIMNDFKSTVADTVNKVNTDNTNNTNNTNNSDNTESNQNQNNNDNHNQNSDSNNTDNKN